MNPDQLEGQALLDDVLGEALGAPLPAQPPAAPEPPQPQAPAKSYLESQLEGKRKQLRELQERIANHKENRAYVRQDAQGNEYIDYMEVQADQARLSQLEWAIKDDEATLHKRREEGKQRTQTAIERSRAFAKAELVRVPESIRQAVGKLFVELFNGLAAQRHWEQPRYADVRAVDADIRQLWVNAIGEIQARGWAGTGAPAATGLDASGQPKDEEKGEELDPYTNNLMYAYEQRKAAKGMTFAEAKRAQQPTPPQNGGRS